MYCSPSCFAVFCCAVLTFPGKSRQALVSLGMSKQTESKEEILPHKVFQTSPSNTKHVECIRNEVQPPATCSHCFEKQMSVKYHDIHSSVQVLMLMSQCPRSVTESTRVSECAMVMIDPSLRQPQLYLNRRGLQRPVESS